MKKLFSVLFSVFAVTSILAQGTGKTAGRDADRYARTPNYGQAARFSQENIQRMVFSTKVQPIWFQNSDRFLYSWKTSQGNNLYLVDPDKGTRKAVFDMPRLAMRLTEIVKDPMDAQHVPMENLKLEEDRYLTFTVASTQKRKFAEGDTTALAREKRGSLQTFHFRYDLQTGELEDRTLEVQDRQALYPDFAVIAPDGMQGVYVKGNDLFLMDSTNLRKAAADPNDSTLVEIRLTNDGSHDFSWGADNYMGNTTVDSTKRIPPAFIVWSPDSKRFATLRWDMSKVKDYWVINSLSMPRPTLETYKYQMPGEPGPEGHLYICDVAKKTFRHIKTAAFKDQDLSFEYAPSRKENQYKEQTPCVREWKGDEKGFYLWRQSRDIHRVDLCYVDVEKDSAEVVLEERMNTYVETRPIVLLDGGRQFIHWSERNGWANLYLYDADGTMVRNLTEGPYHVEEVRGVNEKDGYVVFSASGVNPDENPYQMHTYKVGLKGGEISQLDMDDMDVSALVTENGRYFIANYSRVDHQPGSILYNARTGRKVMDLEEADFSLLMASGYKFPERFKVKAEDGVTDLWGVMYKPFDFDSTKVYPICDYVYPGPQVEGNNISWSAGMTRTDRLAQLGFIVVTVGNRGGHPARSKWYHNYGYGNLRDYGLADQKYAIQQLAARYPFIDIDRVGIHGHSGGGFMSTAAILTYPDFFKVAVSCAGNHDNTIYNRWWSEQHHGIKEKVENGDTTFVYQIETNQELVKNLKGHLLLVHGDTDNNVNPANTIRVVNALIRANKRFDMLFLPGKRHSFGDMNEYFFWKMADYYSEWLMGQSKRGEVDIVEMNNDR